MADPTRASVESLRSNKADKKFKLENVVPLSSPSPKPNNNPKLANLSVVVEKKDEEAVNDKHDDSSEGEESDKKDDSEIVIPMREPITG